MKALTLTQPWATAVALGAKRIETRSWRTNYRGQIAIHAAKGFRVDDLIHYGACWNWCGALGVRMGCAELDRTLPFGAIVAIATIVDCRRTDSFTQSELDEPRRRAGFDITAYSWTERQMGDFSLGRFGFVLDNIQPIEEPIHCKGALGLWNVGPLTERMLTDRLAVAADA